MVSSAHRAKRNNVREITRFSVEWNLKTEKRCRVFRYVFYFAACTGSLKAVYSTLKTLMGVPWEPNGRREYTYMLPTSTYSIISMPTYSRFQSESRQHQKN